MSPRTHFLCTEIFGWVALWVVSAASLGAMCNFETAAMLTLIVLTFAFIFFWNSFKATCKKCSSSMEESTLGTYKYECPKCGWMYDTGEVCSDESDRWVG